MQAGRSVPKHLEKYIVEQKYERYTPEDQAVWRFIMRQLKDFLSMHAHPCYVEGLSKTGISVERIPNIQEMDHRLRELDWGAVAVSGFIPPAAFMEFQSLGILPIACDMRSIDHLMYTPAPDIVHEAAGHAPILIHPEYAQYLKKYAEVARRAIITKDDMAQYEAIRVLSDVKENPDSSPECIQKAEENLILVNSNLRVLSEAGWLSRMNWWTAEYGLIGRLDKPKIFGAGLLSSVAESRHCLSNAVKKIPLSVNCIDYGYDITEPQPQLFVTPDFATLTQVLNQLAEKMAFKLGGAIGLQRILQAETVNTVELSSGVQISGVLVEFKAIHDRPAFIKFIGPSQICYRDKEILGHDKAYHSQGYSTPLGPIKQNLQNISCHHDKILKLDFESGIKVCGRLQKAWPSEKAPAILTLVECSVRLGDEILYAPDWGPFDLALGDYVQSVYAGPADRSAFGETEDFIAARVPQRKVGFQKQKEYDFYKKIRLCREEQGAGWHNLCEEYLRQHTEQWLMGIELLEVFYLLEIKSSEDLAHRLERLLLNFHGTGAVRESIEDGLRLKSIRL